MSKPLRLCLRAVYGSTWRISCYGICSFLDETASQQKTATSRFFAWHDQALSGEIVFEQDRLELAVQGWLRVCPIFGDSFVNTLIILSMPERHILV